jgi:hypothetical protein
MSSTNVQRPEAESAIYGEEDEDEDSASRGRRDNESWVEDALERLELIPSTMAKLSEVNPALGELFRLHFGIAVIEKGKWPSKFYVQLFSQVRWLPCKSVIMLTNSRF